MSDFRHKLCDHVHIISDFEIDIDSPYPIPTRETFINHPNPIPLETVPLKAAHYGRNIQNMINMVAERPDDETRMAMIITLANYMRQQYLIWNKDSVTEDVIFKIKPSSDGRITVRRICIFSPQSECKSSREKLIRRFRTITEPTDKFPPQNKKNQKRNKQGYFNN